MSTDRIEILGLRVLGTHGVLPEERERPQPFALDLVIETDLRAAGASDDLAETVDYADVAETASALVAAKSFFLLEALAEAIAAAVIAEPRIEAVTVGLRKLRPPLARDVSSVGVRITRRRGNAGATG